MIMQRYCVGLALIATGLVYNFPANAAGINEAYCDAIVEQNKNKERVLWCSGYLAALKENPRPAHHGTPSGTGQMGTDVQSGRVILAGDGSGTVGHEVEDILSIQFSEDWRAKRQAGLSYATVFDPKLMPTEQITTLPSGQTQKLIFSEGTALEDYLKTNDATALKNFLETDTNVLDQNGPNLVLIPNIK